MKGIDAKSLVKNCPEFIRTSMLTFFNNVADDVGHTILNLQEVKICLLCVIFFYSLDSGSGKSWVSNIVVGCHYATELRKSSKKLP